VGNSLFERIEPTSIGIDFVNDVSGYTEEFNVYTYRNYYNGGGVGIGDLNNDGLPEIFFTGNKVDNKLYLNKGNFQFEDITSKAGVSSSGVWSTGVSFADVNSDGWLDIYVCKSGNPEGENRNNELFINNGDLTFREESEKWGINDFGLSTHAAFFDFDKDGDLDCYLLNNSFRSVGGYDLRPDQREERDPEGGNKLYRNEGDHFVDISEEAGIYGSNIGFGLGVTIGDVDRDGWQDIYVSNDFFEKDYLYINNRDGTFRESLESSIRELSLGSMGADMADLNNDGFPEIFVTEMLPEREDRLKTKSQFETWDKYQLNVSSGYHKQFGRNVLQLNNGHKPASPEVFFSEIGRYSGVCATDWSWGALIFDMDNDGLKDLFVANGIYKDLLDQDYINFMANPKTVQRILAREDQVITRLVDAMPSEPLANYAFKNLGAMQFQNCAAEWGLGEPGFSNGSAYGDLDNDGDLDLVINNVNLAPFIYRNRASENGNHYITVVLEGFPKNTYALGAQVTVHTAKDSYYLELAPMRGFESTVDQRLHFGLGDADNVDSIEVIWPDQSRSVLQNPQVDEILSITHSNTSPHKLTEPRLETIFQKEEISGLESPHKENDYDDFDRDPLLIEMMSNEGAPIAIADINGDGLEDIFTGGSQGFPGKLYLQSKDATFRLQQSLSNEAAAEDTDAVFFDADKDGDVDLLVASGGSEFSSSSSYLANRLYFNDGDGTFSLSAQQFPFATSATISIGDFDADGDADIFSGSRLRPQLYGVPATSYLYENDGTGNFRLVNDQYAPVLNEFGLVTDSKFADIDLDGDEDLVIVGEWMPVRILINENGRFRESETEMSAYSGFWKSIEIADINDDGRPDLIAGNLGLNSRLEASSEKPLQLFVNDFDRNGQADPIYSMYNGDSTYPVAMLHDLVQQLPMLKKRYLKHEDFKLQGVDEIFNLENLKNTVELKINSLESTAFLNLEDGFQKIDLPLEGQLSPIYSIMAHDLNSDGFMDLIIGGNQHRVKPEIGIYDASVGLILVGKGDAQFKALRATESGVYSEGEIRDIGILKIGKKDHIVISRSNRKLDIYAKN